MDYSNLPGCIHNTSPGTFIREYWTLRSASTSCKIFCARRHQTTPLVPCSCWKQMTLTHFLSTMLNLLILSKSPKLRPRQLEIFSLPINSTSPWSWLGSFVESRFKLSLGVCSRPFSSYEQASSISFAWFLLQCKHHLWEQHIPYWWSYPLIELCAFLLLFKKVNISLSSQLISQLWNHPLSLSFKMRAS